MAKVVRRSGVSARAVRLANPEGEPGQNHTGQVDTLTASVVALAGISSRSLALGRWPLASWRARPARESIPIPD